MWICAQCASVVRQRFEPSVSATQPSRFLCAAGLPYAALLVGVRRGRFEDRHVRERAQRPALLAFTLASVAMGLVALRLLQAPRELFALMAAMVAGMAITLLVSTVWKISIHASCVAGVITSPALLVDARAWWLCSPSWSPPGRGRCSAITPSLRSQRAPPWDRSLQS